MIRTFAIVLGAAIVSIATLNVANAQPMLEGLELPNPDGKNPIFSQTHRGKSVEIEFSSLANDVELSLLDLPAQLRLINYWATWCAPCVRELPSLSRLAERYPSPTLRVVPISLDRVESQHVAEFLSSLNVPHLEWFVDPSRRSGEAVDVIALPTTVFVDSDGKELGRIFGSADWESTEAIQLIEALLSSDEAN